MTHEQFRTVLHAARALRKASAATWGWGGPAWHNAFLALMGTPFDIDTRCIFLNNVMQIGYAPETA